MINGFNSILKLRVEEKDGKYYFKEQVKYENPQGETILFFKFMPQTKRILLYFAPVKELMIQKFRIIDDKNMEGLGTLQFSTETTPVPYSII